MALTPWFNRGHKRSGHLFGTRHKGQWIDERSGDYLRADCDYVHLNPARSGLISVEEALESYPWSSYPAYSKPRFRLGWLRVDRLDSFLLNDLS